MPIYAFRCAACGHAKDLLMKLGDAAPTTCPACGAEAFAKQVTAAGFPLKGSGWYVTDFRGGNGGANAEKGEKSEKADKDGQGDGAKPDTAPGPSDAKAGAKPAADSSPAAAGVSSAAAAPARSSSGKSEPA